MMMKIVITTILLICSTLIGYSQIPKKANKIIIINDKSFDDNYLMVKKTLAKQTVEIANQDKEVGQIKSGLISNKNGSSQFYVFFISDKRIELTGKFNAGYSLTIGGVTDNDSFETIINKGMKGSLYAKTFSNMNDFALQLGETISYKVDEK